MPYNWILFDADNTLFDFNRSEQYALEQAFLDFSIPFEPGFVDVYHKVNKQCWTAFEEGKLDQETLKGRRFELFLTEIGAQGDAKRMGANYLRHLAATDFLIEGARPLLDQFSTTHKMALVTNGLKAVQRPRVARSQTGHYFKAIVVSEEIGASKPGNAFFEHTFEQIGHPPKKEVLIVGDNLNSDIRGGNDFGIDTCWYNPASASNQSGIQPTFEIPSLQHLTAIV